MVGYISWLTEPLSFKTINGTHNHHRMLKNEVFGILAFDTAKTMSRLISLYKAISESEIRCLTNELIKRKGISFLVSQDDGFLLTLACAERLEELDRAASAISRLGLKCSDYGLIQFGQVYKDLKAGYVDMEKLKDYGSKKMEKSVVKMEKFTSLTGELYAELDALAELETSERKLNEWRKSNSTSGMNYDLFDEKVCNQRKLVRHLKDVSLWSQCYDKIVGLMARMTCVLYARICTLFGPYLPKPKQYSLAGDNNPKSQHRSQKSLSGPIHGSGQKASMIRFLSMNSNIFSNGSLEARPRINLLKHTTKVFGAAPPTTVGGSGLANRYANVILLAAKYLNSEVLISDQARGNLYNMLPSSLKNYVRSKLRVAWREEEDEMSTSGDALAEGWRVALREMLEWLVPMAQDTLTWQTERNMEKQRFDAKPTVLLMQTLYYANLEKTEIAIAEVLVGLSYVYWYESRAISCLDMDRY
ncbi:hypothetical protein vseg_020589 [Gypsophila vaccaria]